MTERSETSFQRYRAKRFNEGVKLVATLLNNLAVGTVVAGLLSPLVSGRALPAFGELFLFFVAMILHIFGQTVLRVLFKSED